MHLALQTPLLFFIPLLLVGKLRHSHGKQFAPGHGDSGRQSWALSHVLSPGSHGAGRMAQELAHKSQS